MGRSDQKSIEGHAALPGSVGMRWDGTLGRTTRDVVFFALFYVFLWRVVCPHLIFHGAGRTTNFPSFYTTWGFFTEHLSAPGGPVEYLSAFLSQLFHYSWLGALVITIQAWALGLCVAYLLRATARKALDAVRYIPAPLLLIIYGQYRYFFPTSLSLLFALVLACVYVRLTSRKTQAPALAFFIVLSLVCHYAAGGAFLLFALTCTIRELFLPSRRRLSLPYALIAAGLPYLLAVVLLGVSVVNAYCDLLPISPKLLHYVDRRQGIEVVYILYLLAPGAVVAGGVVSALWTRLSRRRERRRAGRAETPDNKLRRRWESLRSRIAAAPKWRWLAQTVAVVAVGAAVAYGSFDARKKTCFAVDSYAFHQMWPEILAEGRKRYDDRYVMHAVNRALYHTGRLGDEMFRWPQQPEYLFLAGVAHKRSLWANFSVYLEMGLINAAEFALTECLEGLGDRPMILQRLALVNLVKGNLGTARVYLGALDRTLFHRAWARQYIELLDRDPNLATDGNVQRLRSIALEHDFLSVAPATPEMLRRLLEKNPQNRMAFEYMMASYLLNGRLATFIKHLQQFKEIGYRTLPIHFEEAALTYVYGTRKPLYLGGYEPRADLRRQIQGFLEILARHRGNRQAALGELVPHRDTYIFYYVYMRPNKAKPPTREGAGG
ncbi:MAG: DUF6057 family protein [Planctomycetota bacterium]|jgi:hypothetical protein